MLSLVLSLFVAHFWTFLFLFLSSFSIWLFFLSENAQSVPKAQVKSEVIAQNGVPSENTDITQKNGVISCFDPATRQKLGEVKVWTKGEVDQAVEKARKAQEKWSKTSFAERRRVLRILLDYVIENQREIAQVSARDSGKTLVDASLGEIMTTCEKLRWTISEGEAALRSESRSTSLVTLHKRAIVSWEPLGVLAILAPNNYPFHNVYGHIVSGLFAGNAVVLKVSEHTSWSALYYQRIIDGVLRAAGHSTDLVQIVTGFADTGAALVSAKVDKIFFTGSAKVGKIVMRAAAEHLTPVVLELGGKDPMVIFDDADFDQITHVAMRGCYQNSGQNCVGAERFFVHEKIHERFVSEMVKRVKELRQGPTLDKEGLPAPVDLGALVLPGEALRIQSLVDDAVKRGAKVMIGGRPNTEHPGQFYQPTVLVGCNNTMRISQEEVFGPVMEVFKFRTEEEVIGLINDCPFGLGSSVFTLDLDKAQRVARAIRVGMTNINDFGINYLCQSMPFGGVKESGFDRFAGIEGLRGCCHMKSSTKDWIPGVRTNIPPPLQYPMGTNAAPFAESLITLLYARTLKAKLAAIWGLIKNGGRK